MYPHEDGPTDEQIDRAVRYARSKTPTQQQQEPTLWRARWVAQHRGYPVAIHLLVYAHDEREAKFESSNFILGKATFVMAEPLEG